jgi:hypothetical protein
MRVTGCFAESEGKVLPGMLAATFVFTAAFGSTSAQTPVTTHTSPQPQLKGETKAAPDNGSAG